MQRPKFTSAVGNCRGFCRGKRCFNSNHRGKKIAEVIIPSKIYVQFKIFSTYFSTKFLFTDKKYYLHVLEKCLHVLQKVGSITYAWHWNKLCFHVYIILSAKFYDVTFLNNFYFVSFFYHLFICRRQRKIRLVRYTNSDLKISLYVWVDIKTIPWKFHIPNSKYWVICPWIW